MVMVMVTVTMMGENDLNPEGFAVARAGDTGLEKGPATRSLSGQRVYYSIEGPKLLVNRWYCGLYPSRVQPGERLGVETPWLLLRRFQDERLQWQRSVKHSGPLCGQNNIFQQSTRSTLLLLLLLV